jgi:hypothetical protein
LIKGVPLQSGQLAARRLKKAMIPVTMLIPNPPSMNFNESGLDSLKNNTAEVIVEINPRKYKAVKIAAMLKGRLDGRERSRGTFGFGSEKLLVFFPARISISPQTLKKLTFLYKS